LICAPEAVVAKIEALMKMHVSILACLVCLPLLAQDADRALRARIEASPRLAFTGVPLAVHAPAVGWESGMVSWLAVDGKGVIYVIQRGEKADPVQVLDREGKLLRSWGKGDYTIPRPAKLRSNREPKAIYYELLARIRHFASGLMMSPSMSGWASTRTRWGYCSPPW
jgi:hypothetical protein